MPDLLGPGAAGALNAVTSRPPFTPLNQGPSDPDTWVRDCTSPIAADGTQDKAAHMNMLIAQVRNLVRSGAITENSANDFMMMQAVRAQRGNWLTAGGSATAITLAPSPAFAARADLIGVPLRFIALSAATGATTLTVNSLSAVALTWPDGTAIASGDWGVGTELEVMDDGTAFRLLTPLSPTQINTNRLRAPYIGFEGSAVSQSVVSGVVTRIASYAGVVNTLPGASYAAGALALGVSGKYFLSANLNVLLPDVGNYGASIAISRVDGSNNIITSVGAQPIECLATSPPSTRSGSVSVLSRLSAGDRVAVFFTHNRGANLNISISLDVEFRGV